MCRLFCRLTGGHKYKNETLVSYHCPITEEFWFGNFCAKCGTVKQWTIPAEAILGELKMDVTDINVGNKGQEERPCD